MKYLNSRMPRQDLEAIAFWQVEYNQWKAAPLSTDEPAKPIEGIPIDRAEQLFKGNQLEMAIPPLDIQKLFEFFEAIDDGERWYYMGGLLKHPNLHQQQPAFFGTLIDGPALSDQEFDTFLAQFRASVDTLQNRSGEPYGDSFYAFWGFPDWLPNETKDQLDPHHTPTRLPDKSYIKWNGKELSRLD